VEDRQHIGHVAEEGQMTDLNIAALRARAKAKVRKSGPPCGACALPDKTRAIVKQLHSEGLSYVVIALTMQEEGVTVKAGTYAKHFREHDRSR
jgi:hypothetical protein